VDFVIVKSGALTHIVTLEKNNNQRSNNENTRRRKARDRLQRQGACESRPQ
jgi:hypothetical protein